MRHRQAGITALHQVFDDLIVVIIQVNPVQFGMRGHDCVHTAVSETENSIHHRLFCFIKDASLSSFLDISL